MSYINATADLVNPSSNDACYLCDNHLPARAIDYPEDYYCNSCGNGYCDDHVHCITVCPGCNRGFCINCADPDGSGYCMDCIH